ncbi:MAG: 4Fe-4S binding protein [Campylobacteraceae bacterium]|nr:4Fe-4S binding protein [Campylobacteraceae bacterium]
MPSRRGFFKALAPKKDFILRPPYADDVSSFYENCLTCKDKPCVNACEEDIIQIKDNLPYISFEKSGCSYCKECALACDKDVLHEQTPHQINALFSIDTQECLAWNGVVCFSCKDYCDEKAINFFGMFKPLVNEKCTSCGFCVAPCPNDAIKIKERF